MTVSAYAYVCVHVLQSGPWPILKSSHHSSRLGFQIACLYMYVHYEFVSKVLHHKGLEASPHTPALPAVKTTQYCSPPYAKNPFVLHDSLNIAPNGNTKSNPSLCPSMEWSFSLYALKHMALAPHTAVTMGATWPGGRRTNTGSTKKAIWKNSDTEKEGSYSVQIGFVVSSWLSC